MPAREALGVDVGGVLIPRVGVDADTTFKSENYLETPEIPDAFDVLRRLVDEMFGRRVFIVSKCGARVQTKTLRWLKHHRFFERTGVKPKHVHFCLERSDKAPICRKLGITHFIDDRLDVLLSLQTVPNRILFASDHSSGDTNAALALTIQQVRTWKEVGAALLR